MTKGIDQSCIDVSRILYRVDLLIISIVKPSLYIGHSESPSHFLIHTYWLQVSHKYLYTNHNVRVVQNRDSPNISLRIQRRHQTLSNQLRSLRRSRHPLDCISPFWNNLSVEELWSIEEYLLSRLSGIQRMSSSDSGGVTTVSFTGVEAPDECNKGVHSPPSSLAFGDAGRSFRSGPTFASVCRASQCSGNRRWSPTARRSYSLNTNRSWR
jgi:hypothetical protein